MSDIATKARKGRHTALKLTRGVRTNVFFDASEGPRAERGTVLEMLAGLSLLNAGHERAIVRRLA